MSGAQRMNEAGHDDPVCRKGTWGSPETDGPTGGVWPARLALALDRASFNPSYRAVPPQGRSRRMGRFLRHPSEGGGWSTPRLEPHRSRSSDHTAPAATADRWLARAGCDVILLPTQALPEAQKVPWDLRRLPIGRTELTRP